MKLTSYDLALYALLGSAIVLGCRTTVPLDTELEANRNRAEVARFMRESGYPRGRSGYVVDHVIPLCAGGPDVVENMAWEERQASYRKDTFERQLCAAMKRHHLVMRQEVP